MIPLDEALGLLDRSLSGGVSLPSETLPLRQAAGRILAADQHSRLDLPPFDKSAVDGYAVPIGDQREQYRLVGTVAAGEAGLEELQPGTTAKVMTGAPVPPGAGAMVMLEYVEDRDGMVKIPPWKDGANICKRGEDVRTGDVVLRAGDRLGSVEIANLIGSGLTEIPVVRRPRMAILSTGDEIVATPDLIEHGKIMNSNGPLLSGLAADYGLEVVIEQAVPDDPEATRLAIAQALEQADLVVLSGGVSVGEFDYVLDALPRAGLTVHFSRVAVKPGKPTVCASGGGKSAFGLPGNPVAVYLMFHLFVLRAIDWMTSGEPLDRHVALPLAEAFTRRKTDRLQYVPAAVAREGTLRRVGFHGSAHLTALHEADGFFRVPLGVANLDAGGCVDFLPTRPMGRRSR